MPVKNSKVNQIPTSAIKRDILNILGKSCSMCPIDTSLKQSSISQNGKSQKVTFLTTLKVVLTD